MKVFDLVLIKYDGGGHEVCIAPRLKVLEGDVVVTDFGMGKVLKTAFATEDDEIFQIYSKAGTIHKVQAVMQLLKYDD